MLDNQKLSETLGVKRTVVDLVLSAENKMSDVFQRFDMLSKQNQATVLSAFKAEKIASAHFNPTTGYGYSDMGREKLSALFSRVFNGQKALVSPHLLSGTHTIYLMLKSLLKPGDTLLSVAGMPYDTLATAIGLTDKVKKNTLIENGTHYRQIDLTVDGLIDLEALQSTLLSEKPAIVYIQRSRGYAWRSSVSIATINRIATMTKELSPNSLVICDNCYGEFCETSEPIVSGADIIAGSLIKNPGGGIAPNGGYIVGKSELIDEIEAHFTAPGIGAEVGSYAGSYLPFFQGLFLAPKIVAESLKGAALTAKVMETLGYDVLPKAMDDRTDITQSIKLKSEEELIAFIQGVQKGSPVESHVLPVPWDMPGYENPVIMAAGTFMQGASLELSADAPIKKPCIAYMQGGLTYEAHQFGLMHAID
ncbi:MAG: methionine gamma-lyase family protein, partial [Eubacteriales bacterium]